MTIIPLINREIYDSANEERMIETSGKGITESVVRQISKNKQEPEWMLKKRLEALELFNKMPMPEWGPDLKKLDLNEITYFAISDSAANTKSWDQVPEDIKNTFERLGIPEAERKVLAGVGAQYESQVVYHSLKEEWAKKGVIFEDMDIAVQKYPELVQEYFMKCVPASLHKFAALHAAVWSGGTFLYIPKNVNVDIPLQAYFRMNAKSMGQFEHTLIIVDEGAQVHYIEGCFIAGNKVMSNDGYVNIEDVKEGDKVLTSEGDYKKVEKVHAIPYSGELYDIELYGNSTVKIEVTKEHPFLYVSRDKIHDRNKVFKPFWNIPKYFKRMDYLAVPINQKIKTTKFYEFETYRSAGRHNPKKVITRVPLINEFFRLVGYYLAEGSISAASYLNFSFNANERLYIEDVKYCLRKVFGITKILETHHAKNHGTNVVVCSVDLARIFKQFGNKHDRKSILPWMMTETLEHQKQIIKGWYWGDGNYYNQISKKTGVIKESFRMNTTSEKLVGQIRDVLFRFGVVSFINKQERMKSGRKTMYTLGVTGAYMRDFAKISGMKSTKKLNGKNRASMFGINKKFAFFPIKNISVRKVNNLPVFNLRVKDHETYTVGGVAVHNCSAPLHSKNSLHAGCVEVFVKKNARARYSSVENWSKNTYNLNTKRAIVDEHGIIEWVGGNLGSGCTMLYPCSILRGEYSKAEHIGIALAAKGQNQDVGAKVYHVAPHTTSIISSKSISLDGGITTYRGLVKISKSAHHSKSNVNCDALMTDNVSASNTVPYIEVSAKDCDIAHEATCGKLSEESLFYLMSRGLKKEQAMQMLVSGFIEPVVKELPVEYAVELNKLIEMEMEGSLG